MGTAIFRSTAWLSLRWWLAIGAFQAAREVTRGFDIGELQWTSACGLLYIAACAWFSVEIRGATVKWTWDAFCRRLVHILVWALLAEASRMPLSARLHMGTSAVLDLLALAILPPAGYALAEYIRRHPRRQQAWQ